MRVLIIEDAKWSSSQEISEALKDHKEIELGFCNPNYASKVAEVYHYIDVCVIDACEGPNRQISTAALASRIRKSFKGSMIAVSSIPYSRIPLLNAGCTYACSKSKLPKILIYLASNPPPKAVAGEISIPVA